MNPELKNLLNQVKALPYGRNSIRSEYLLVPNEQKGTCSTKHAYVKHMADLNGWQNVQLFIGNDLMSEKNTAGVGTILKTYGLDAIPEAHTYLEIDGEIVDVTGLENGHEPFFNSLLKEIEIHPDQIEEFKLAFHKTMLQDWAKNTNYSSKELWEIREEYIKTLSEKR